MANITVTPEGETLLEWWWQNRKLSIYVGDDSAWFLSIRDRDFDFEGDVSLADLLDAARLAAAPRGSGHGDEGAL